MRVLVVDEDVTNRDVVCTLAERLTDNKPQVCKNAKEALAYTATELFDIVIVDQRMPDMAGSQFIQRLRAVDRYQSVPIVMLIMGNNDGTARKEAVRSGVTDFLTKPIEPIESAARLKNLIQLRRLYIDKATSASRLSGAIEQATQQLRERELEVIESLSLAIEYHDGNMGGHSTRMARLCRIIAEELGMSRDYASMLYLAAPLHDIGKIGVPDHILQKLGQPTEAERRILEQHVSIGEKLLRNGKSDLLKMACSIAVYHHERWDGKGYPKGLSAENIPIEGRIACVADVFEALISDRVYRPAWKAVEARRFMVKNSGTQFDPACVNALMKGWPRVEAMLQLEAESHLRSGAKFILTTNATVAARELAKAS